MARNRGSGRKTDYQWSNVGASTETIDLDKAESTFGTSAMELNLPATLTRTRGFVGVTLDPGAADEHVIILCGLTVVNRDEFVAGNAPDMLVDGLSDEGSWLWQGALYVSSGAEAAVITDGLIASIEIDSKAMRRMKPTEVVAFVHQAPAALTRDQGGTYDITYYVHSFFGS